MAIFWRRKVRVSARAFGPRFAEDSGRGLEGLAVRWRDDQWQVAASLEGGFYDWKSARGGDVAKPRIALLGWRRGQGCDGEPETIELDVPVPSAKQRFRAPDLTWAGDHLLVLLTSTDKKRKKKKHTWLQRFDLTGSAHGQPLKLEKAWGDYHDGKNWEGLDWALSGAELVLAHDQKDPEKHQALTIFPYG